MFGSLSQRTKRFVRWFFAIGTAVVIIVIASYIPQETPSGPSGSLKLTAQLEADATVRIQRAEDVPMGESSVSTAIMLPRLTYQSRDTIEAVRASVDGGPVTPYSAVERIWDGSDLRCGFDEPPATGHWYFDRVGQVLYVCHPGQGKMAHVEVDYSSTNAVHYYEDSAFIQLGLIESDKTYQSAPVSVRIALPATGANAAEQIRYFGGFAAADHVTLEGGEVRAEIPEVKAGDTALIGVAFPPQWLSELPAYYPYGGRGPGQDVANIFANLRDLKAQQAQSDRFWSVARIVASLAPGVVCLFFTVFQLIQFSQRRQARFQGKYWRDNPGAGVALDRPFPADVHPLVVATNYNGSAPGRNAFKASLLRLSVRGYVRFEQVGEDYVFSLTGKQPGTSSADLIDRAVMDFVFDGIADGGETMSTQLLRQTQPDEKRVKRAGAKLAALIDLQCTALGVRASQLPVAGLSNLYLGWYQLLACLIATTVYGPLFGKGLPVLLFNLGCLLLTIAVGFTFRGTLPPNGLELYAYTDGLRRWLNDFTALEDSTAETSEVWGQYLVFAVLFDIPDKVFAAYSARGGSAYMLSTLDIFLLPSDDSLTSGTSLRAALGDDAINLADAIAHTKEGGTNAR